MKLQFHLSHVDDSSLQMYSKEFFNICYDEFKMFFHVFVSSGDTGQFFGETTAYEQCIALLISKHLRLWFCFNSKVCFRGMRADLSI